MTKALLRLKCVLYKADPDFIELWCGCLTFAFGAFFLLPVKTFTAVSIYAPLSRVMSEESWGIIFVMVGALKVVVYLAGNYKQRRWCLLIMTFLWTLVTSTILTEWSDHPYSAAPLLFSFIDIAIVWAFIRVGITQTVRESLYGNGRKNPPSI